MFTHFYSASILQPAEGTARTSVHVVCCLGSLKLLEPSRISQPAPVGCSPFHSSLHFYFFTLSNSLFSFFSLPLFSNCFSIERICICAAAPDRSSLSVLLCWLLNVSTFSQPSPSVSNTSRVSFFSLWGFQKGHKGGENFLQHMLVRCAEKGVC